MDGLGSSGRGGQRTFGAHHPIWVPAAFHHAIEAEGPLELVTLRLRAGLWAAQASGDREAIALVRQIDAVARMSDLALPLSPSGYERANEILREIPHFHKKTQLPYYHCKLKADAMELLYPALHSWQIDNEMAGVDYGPETRGHFHEWLKAKFGTVEAMNAAWGLEFWSQAYTDFAQVPLVTASVGSVEVPERHHPSLIMAIATFQNNGWTSFIKHQADLIRAKSDKPISTNMTGMVGAMNWFQHNQELDHVGASMYADRRYYYYNLPRFDRMRTEKDVPYWLMETAPNWSGGGRTFNIHFDHHGPRLFSWISTLLGGNMVLFWQWREHWAGQEMLHGTHVTATGDWRPGKECWTRLASEFAQESTWLDQNPPAQAEIALVMSNEASWAFSIDPTDTNMVYGNNFRDELYLPFAQKHWWRDVIHESADFSPTRSLPCPTCPKSRKTLGSA